MKSFLCVIILLCQGYIDCSKSLQLVGHPEYADDSSFVVSIQKRRVHVCCGSIVASTWVLTASACFKLFEFKEFKIRYGVLDNLYDIHNKTLLREIIGQIPSEHDVLSLLKVDRLFWNKVFGEFPKLPKSEDSLKAGDYGTVYGWDRGTGEPTNLLKCEMFFINERQEMVNNHIETDYEFNAGGNGIGLSEGNIGSPFVSGTKLVGIASDISTFNGSSPDIFYRVSQFEEWIRNTTR